MRSAKMGALLCAVGLGVSGVAGAAAWVQAAQPPNPHWFEIQMIAEADKEHPAGWVLSCHFIEDGNRVCQLRGK